MSAPGSKDDLKAMLGNWVESTRNAYRIQLHDTLAKFTRNPRSITPNNLAQVLSISGDAQAYDKAAQTKDVDRTLCALFGSLVNKALLKEIDSMPWPANAITGTERAATSLQPVIEPLLDGVSPATWYAAARNSQVDTVEYAYLEGAEGPVIEVQNTFEVDGMSVKCRLDFAAKAIDYRGLFKGVGAAS